jgi:hypothetical protein
MKPCIEIKPLYGNIHIDQYNRLFIFNSNTKQYKAYRCETCKMQLSYFPNAGGGGGIVVCTDNLLHKQQQQSQIQ